MKKTLGALLLTIGLAALPLHAADAAPGDLVKGKSCYDFNADMNYADRFPSNAPERQFTPTVGGSIETVQPSCPDAYITLTVFDTDGNVLGTPDVKRGDGVSSVFGVSVEVPTGPATVCVLLTTETPSHRVVDQAPDQTEDGCAVGGVFLINGGTGGRPMG